MADLTVSATITRTDLGLSDLELNQGNYRLAGHNLDIGNVQRRREVATSPFVHGGIEVASVKDMATLSLAVQVTAPTLANLFTAMDTLITAFEQDTYTITFDIDGAGLTYECNAAEFETGLVTPRMAARKILIGFECPRQPGTGVGS